MENKVKIAFNNYFNSILKNSLKYPETFNINLNLNNREIIITSDVDSQLIQSLKNNDKLLNDLSNNLLIAFQQINSDINLVRIGLINEKKFIIKYQVTFEALSQVDVMANIAENLTLLELNNLCEHDPKFRRTCESQQFWINLIVTRFGEIPKKINKNVNWKLLYRDVVEYIEYQEENISPFSVYADMINCIDLNNKSQKYVYLHKHIIERINHYNLITQLYDELETRPYPNIMQLNKFDAIFLLEKKLLTFIDAYSLLRNKFLPDDVSILDLDVMKSFVDNYNMNFDIVKELLNLLSKYKAKNEKRVFTKEEIEKWEHIIIKLNKLFDDHEKK